MIPFLQKGHLSLTLEQCSPKLSIQQVEGI
jgi:hypothetical protein